MNEEKNKLPPLSDDSFDGYSEKTELRIDRCVHKDTVVISGNELMCRGCSAHWHGSDIVNLHNILSHRA